MRPRSISWNIAQRMKRSKVDKYAEEEKDEVEYNFLTQIDRSTVLAKLQMI